MTKMRLTQKIVDGLTGPASGKGATFWDDELSGFGRRWQAGRWSWVVRYRVAGSQRQKSLPGNLSLAKARREAADIITAASKGSDLVADGRAAALERRRQERERRLADEAKRTRQLAAIIERYIPHAEAVLVASTMREIRRYLLRHWRPLHGHIADELDRRTIIARLEDIQAESGSGAANRARAYLSGCLAWGVMRGLLDRNAVNGVKPLASERTRDRVLTRDELRQVWEACAGADDFSHIVRLLILTGARRQEIGSMAWNELDLDRGEWTLPGERSKNGRPLVLPLPRQALELLLSRQRVEGRGFVFGRGKGFSGWGRAKARLDRAAGVTNWTLHDLRRTAVTRMGEELGIQPHVVEAIVNHQSGHKAGVAGVYNRATYAAEKRQALQRWADHLSGEREGSNVVKLRA